MDIPVVPVRIVRNEIISSDIIFSGGSAAMGDNTVRYADLISSDDTNNKNAPVLIIDVKGMQRKDIMPDILKRVRSKRELWFMTGVRDAGDLIDAFQSDMSKVAVPYHFTSDRLLKDMIEISDCCIPALFADRNGVHMKGKRNDLRNVVRSLENMNFRRVLVFDVSGGGWDGINDLCDTVVPFVAPGEDRDAVHDLGFRDVMFQAVGPSSNKA